MQNVPDSPSIAPITQNSKLDFSLQKSKWKSIFSLVSCSSVFSISRVAWYSIDTFTSSRPVKKWKFYQFPQGQTIYKAWLKPARWSALYSHAARGLLLLIGIYYTNMSTHSYLDFSQSLLLMQFVYISSCLVIHKDLVIAHFYWAPSRCQHEVNQVCRWTEFLLIYGSRSRFETFKKPSQKAN